MVRHVEPLEFYRKIKNSNTKIFVHTNFHAQHFFSNPCGYFCDHKKNKIKIKIRNKNKKSETFWEDLVKRRFMQKKFEKNLCENNFGKKFISAKILGVRHGAAYLVR